MRKVTQTVVSAFLAGQSRQVGNTSTDGSGLYLNGNRIARKDAGGIIVTTCGWNTPTTKERLNAIPGVQVYQKARKFYLNGKPWDGSETLIAA